MPETLRDDEPTGFEFLMKRAIEEGRRGQWLNVLAMLNAANLNAITRLNDVLKGRNRLDGGG